MEAGSQAVNYAADLSDVRQAAARIAAYIHRTPVTTCAAIDAAAGRRIFFKCEHLQKVGAFKFRGACNAVLQLSEGEAKRGVATHSSGNHAQALALAARLRGIPAYVVMPTSASSVKRSAVEEYGAKVIPCEPTLIAREETAKQVCEETGAAFIHPFNHPHILAGAGTAALELHEQIPDLDAIVAPIGGGGLMSGVCAATPVATGIPIYGAEPQGADDAFRSKQSGKLIPQESPNTIADGLLTSLGNLTWPFINDRVEQIFTVSDEETIAAMRLVWQRAKLLIEPSAAVSVAVILSDAFRALPGAQAVGVILSGGNVDIDKLPW